MEKHNKDDQDVLAYIPINQLHDIERDKLFIYS